MTNSPLPPYQPGNVQGIILRGYTHPHSCHMLFTFTDRPGAAGFIRALLPYVQSAVAWSDKPERMLNIGLTFNGILTFEPGFKNQFPSEFKDGPWSGDSQLSLQDTGASDPSTWWNGQDKQAIHCIVHVYGMTDDALDSLVTVVSQSAATNSVSEILPFGPESDRLQQYAPLKNFIHFGYRDSIDNPGLGWPVDPAGPAGQMKSDPGDANNFLIGYPEAGSQFHPGPLFGPAGEFAKDGCYNAFRVLHQDVGVFEQFLTDTAPVVVAAIGGSEDHAREWLAAKLVGRWRNGSPLVLSPDKPCSTTSGATDFLYEPDDRDGFKCPFSAHSRVANPRDQAVYISDAPVPRLIRRGVPYGAPPAPPKYEGECGLVGLFLCGALAGQFEMLYSWMNTNGFSAKFAPGLNTQDALLANRGAAGDPSFTIAIAKDKKIKIPSLPQFIVTRGTAYCLLPSMKTLRRVAGLSE
ncbi:hypothetical protein [Bradyrhizobium sp. AUGA SZCCT0431]|uniref:Dyp-type peroxidase n=1 Tax=Bradyrhizobium sp. AUGA SZCCT0431 TaxID=2807674 RepID=UPI001BAD6690|nr:hypothetical protein [Bradyrhizobium sp. AUGA SZCCT0431]MBR1144562.1 hypothetical protein [Bradyrhizobium sp. AUGA SZCCT0431]